jgi:DNA-binding MltR family transcriptional regulator
MNGLADREYTRSAYQRLYRMTDGEAAIVGAQLIDVAIERAIRYHFKHFNTDSLTRLFEYPNPLSTLSAKIKIGYGLKLFSQISLGDVEKIQQIRNAFAHSLLQLTFEHKDIKLIIDKFESSDDFYRRSPTHYPLLGPY